MFDIINNIHELINAQKEYQKQLCYSLPNKPKNWIEKEKQLLYNIIDGL